MDSFKTRIYISIFISCLTVGIILLAIVRSIYKYQKRYRQLQHDYFNTEDQLLQKERKRIAGDFHDELGAMLTLTHRQVEAAILDPSASDDLLVKAKHNLLQAIKRMGEIIRDLDNSQLLPYGLHTAISHFIAQFLEVTDLQINYRYAVTRALPADFAAHIYYIIHELLHNMLQHAAANTVFLHLKEQKGHLYIYYRDNGQGIKNTNQPTHHKGRGLHNLSGRTQFLAGRMQLRTTSSGTSYFFEIPLPANY
jgi:two-component system NarL family sensor kinase